MQRGDLVRLKKISGTVFGHEGQAVIFSDLQLRRLEVLVHGDLHSLYSKDKNHSFLCFGEVAIVLDTKNIFKNEIIWNSFIKVVTSKGFVGWISKEHLTHIFK